MIIYPKTKEEYWLLVDAHWEDLYNILFSFLDKNELSKADNLRLTKNSDLSFLFQHAWENAPDSKSIHYIPGWNILCNLCSESYVLYEDYNDDN
jgi:predicted N-acyltransferase